MKLRIEIDLSNDAFYPSQGWEASRILKLLAYDIAGCEDLRLLLEPLRDINGNVVGKAETTGE